MACTQGEARVLDAEKAQRKLRMGGMTYAIPDELVNCPADAEQTGVLALRLVGHGEKERRGR